MVNWFTALQLKHLRSMTSDQSADLPHRDPRLKPTDHIDCKSAVTPRQKNTYLATETPQYLAKRWFK